MLEYYSKNTVVELGAAGAESIVPFTNQKLLKGCNAVMAGNTLQLNKCGIHHVDCDVCFTSNTAGNITFELYVDGVAQPQTEMTETITTAGSFKTIHLNTYVTKQDNNCRCNPCTAPTNVYLAVSASVADAEITFQTTDIQSYQAR